MREYTDTCTGSVISEAIRDAEVDNTTGRTSHLSKQCAFFLHPFKLTKYEIRRMKETRSTA